MMGVSKAARITYGMTSGRQRLAILEPRANLGKGGPPGRGAGFQAGAIRFLPVSGMAARMTMNAIRATAASVRKAAL